jgi:hypothetical protein
LFHAAKQEGNKKKHQKLKIACFFSFFQKSGLAPPLSPFLGPKIAQIGKQGCETGGANALVSTYQPLTTLWWCDFSKKKVVFGQFSGTL